MYILYMYSVLIKLQLAASCYELSCTDLPTLRVQLR